MSDKPKPGGYIDNAALQRAVDANEALARLLPAIVDELQRLPHPVARKMQRAGFELVRQRSALAEMEVIRANYKAKNR